MKMTACPAKTRPSVMLKTLRLTTFGVRFTSQVWPGDTLTAKATVQAIREEGGKHFVDLAVSTVNQSGVEVVNGYASARIDP